MEKIHVVAVSWVHDNHLGLHIPPDTEGDVVRHGSCKDFGVKFIGEKFSKYVLEVNLHDDIKIISPITH